MPSFVQIIKYILFSLNSVICLLGISILVLGALNLTAHLQKISSFLFIIPVCLLTVGVIILTVSLFGFFGAILQNRCLILTFIAFIVIIFVLELLGGFALYSLYNEETVSKKLKESLNYYNTEKDIKKFWDFVNKNLNCCGVNSYADYGDNIPNSCCKDLDINDVCHKEQAYQVGCLPVMVKYFKEITPKLLTSVAVLQLFSILLAALIICC